MKKILLVLVSTLVILPLILTACDNSGPSVTKQFSYSYFSNVQVGSGFEVEITPSTTYNVAVTAPESWLSKINFKQSGATLEVSMDWGWEFWHNWGISRPKLQISMPELDILDLSGASKGTALGFQSNQDFMLELSGASTASIDIEAYDTSITVSGASRLNGKLVVHDIRLNVSGASNATLTGSGNNLNLQVSGASGATLDGLTAIDTRAEVSGASRASVYASGRLDVFLSGASNLQYTGNPTIGTVDITGASSFHQK